jgi:uncharacterized cupredoxin-like copper-binding protein
VRRAALLALAVALLAADTAAAAPTRLLIEAREFNLTLSRAKVKRGHAIVQMVNRGQDPHDLAFERIGGGHKRAIAKTLPGDLGEWEGRLRKGRYRLLCTIEGHRALGMRATLRVR